MFNFSSPSSVSSIENSNHLPNTTPPPHVWYDSSSQNSNSGKTYEYLLVGGDCGIGVTADDITCATHKMLFNSLSAEFQKWNFSV